MTQEEKARAYDEALERARALRQEAIDKEYAIDYVKDYEAIFPELRESEDERIRKDIIEFAKVRISGGDIEAGPHKWEEWIAYLEKQKDLDKMIVVSPEVWDNAITDAYENGKKDGEKQKEPHYTKRNALFDKCVENCDPAVMKKVSDEIDEMLEKEQKSVKCELEDAFKYYTDAGITIQEHENIFEDTYQMIARHFYELGKNSK